MLERYETFTVLIAKLSKCIRKIKSEEMSEYNLKNSHVSCLYYLYKMEALTATKLCEICGEDKASISRAIDFLEENGYINCSSTAKKRYNSVLILTEKGQQIASKIAEKIDKILEKVIIGLNNDDRVIMYKSLNLISNNLESFCKKYEGD